MPRYGWLLYDGACGFCSWWVPRLEKLLNKYGFQIAPLQTQWVRDRLKVTDDELLQELRLLLNDGQQVLGADAYLWVMKKIPYLLPLALLFSLPGLHAVFSWGYRKFAGNRYLFS